MGFYLNPGNSGFASARNDIYVDKSGLVALMNKAIDTPSRLICVSRPRRFGKSFAAKMLCAYYDRSCDSSGLFDDLEIARKPEYAASYRKHLNQYDVICLDMAAMIGETSIEDLPSYVKRNVSAELREAYPDAKDAEGFVPTLANVVAMTGRKFVVVIDEWDAPIRESGNNHKLHHEYLEFLRSLFKNSAATDKVFAAAYMTGILPIKRDGTQSAISEFREYSIIHPTEFAEYVGFTEDEVKSLCAEHGGDFSGMKLWYDGYTFGKVDSVYNPNSVMRALHNQEFRSYWTQTSASDCLMGYISLDFDGMSKTVAELIGGSAVLVDTNGFANDMTVFQNRDDVLTLLIHLGYLTYESETETAHIPNEEIRQEFARVIRNVKREDTVRRVRESDQLIIDTVQGNAVAVAAQIEKIHREETSPLFYNDEQALRGVIKLAYFSYRDQYLKFEELPSGDGYADIVYFPKKRSPLPVLVIELKWNQSARGAIAQIRDRQYPEALQGHGGEILLVGIGYEKGAGDGKRKHECVIERIPVHE